MKPNPISQSEKGLHKPFLHRDLCSHVHLSQNVNASSIYCCGQGILVAEKGADIRILLIFLLLPLPEPDKMLRLFLGGKDGNWQPFTVMEAVTQFQNQNQFQMKNCLNHQTSGMGKSSDFVNHCILQYSVIGMLFTNTKRISRGRCQGLDLEGCNILDIILFLQRKNNNIRIPLWCIC